ncbi:MAG: AAA domain-containing protein [Lentisphaerae bacterium]|nr:AAA domain-containing protein [Lentisphaerota bacterium]
MTDPLMTPEELASKTRLIKQTLEQLDAILLGRADLHRMVLAGILSRGHILLEGLPGLGKTALIHALGQVLQLDFKRVQFTPDLMPSDIVGAHILQQQEDGRREMQFQPGPVFTNILLADEINRASPKTQSALLETMQEHSVTLLGSTRALPEPFFVLASQNPIELEGTYPLPEAQLDRFLFKIPVGAVSVDTLQEIIRSRRRGEPPVPTWRLDPEALASLFDAMDRVVMAPAVARYIARLVSATHPGNTEAPELVAQYVQYGVSPRAAIGMAEAARAWALINNRPTVGFEDVRTVAPYVLNHRLVLNYRARFDQLGAYDLVVQLLGQIPETEMELPKNVKVGEGKA